MSENSKEKSSVIEEKKQESLNSNSNLGKNENLLTYSKNKNTLSQENYLNSDFFNSDENILKNIKFHITKVFHKEIQDEIKLEEKYKLNHTEEELKYRKDLQNKHRGSNVSERRKFLNSFWISFKWIRKHYLTFSTKNNFEEYEYAKHILWRYFKLICYGCLYGSGYTFIMFLWMRLLKHKGRKDKYYLIGMNFFMSLTLISNFTYNTLYSTRLPLSTKDLDARKELLEEFVFGSNKSFILTQEIKKISKFYLKEKIEHVYITPHSGQKVTFIITDGRLYLSCTDYSEVFGYNTGNIKAKIENLNYYNLRDRDVILGLIELYDLLIKKYKEKFNIKDEVKTINTELLEEIVKNKNLSEKNLENLKKSKLLQDIEYSKIEIGKDQNDSSSVALKEDHQQLENADKNETERKKPKFYF